MRLIVSDLDGTLLGPDGTIPAVNVAAIREAHEFGVPFVVATGRPVRWLHCLAPIADLRPYVIASNGAVLYDLASSRVLSVHHFDADAVGAITSEIRSAVAGVTFGIERGDLFGLEPGSPSEHSDFPGVLHLPLASLIERVTPAVKVLAYCQGLGCDALASAVTAAVGGRATVTSSLVHDEFGLAELSVPGVTKATALADLCAELDVDASEVVAFGDMPNDAEMLDWAGRGYVTADAHPSLIARFPGVGACGDGGVGRMIRTLLAC